MSDMGDGDLYDPDDLSDAELTGTVSRSASESAAAADAAAASTTDGDDTPERQSEFDDVDTLSALDFDTPDAGGAEADIDWSEVDVPALLAERDEFKSIAQRVQAEFENFRKQANIRAQADAVGPLLNQMLTELKKQGLESLDLDGQLFDPEVAEAVAHEPVDGGEPLVAEVLRSGYQWKGKTLRAAMVNTKD